jgi:hypothetical protein
MLTKGGNMSLHNHGAAVSGVKSETKMARVIRRKGHIILKTKKDFKKNGVDEWGTRYHKPPKYWSQKTRTGKQRRFVADGFILLKNRKNRGIILEQKNSNAHGTTEEKVFYDLEKIRQGVYGKKHELWYVFTGKVCHEVEAYKEFEIQAKAEKLPVKIIFGWEAFEKELENINGGK